MLKSDHCKKFSLKTFQLSTSIRSPKNTFLISVSHEYFSVCYRFMSSRSQPGHHYRIPHNNNNTNSLSIRPEEEEGHMHIRRIMWWPGLAIKKNSFLSWEYLCRTVFGVYMCMLDVDGSNVVSVDTIIVIIIMLLPCIRWYHPLISQMICMGIMAEWNMQPTRLCVYTNMLQSKLGRKRHTRMESERFC